MLYIFLVSLLLTAFYFYFYKNKDSVRTDNETSEKQMSIPSFRVITDGSKKKIVSSTELKAPDKESKVKPTPIEEKSEENKALIQKTKETLQRRELPPQPSPSFKEPVDEKQISFRDKSEILKTPNQGELQVSLCDKVTDKVTIELLSASSAPSEGFSREHKKQDIDEISQKEAFAPLIEPVVESKQEALRQQEPKIEKRPKSIREKMRLKRTSGRSQRVRSHFKKVKSLIEKKKGSKKKKESNSKESRSQISEKKSRSKSSKKKKSSKSSDDQESSSKKPGKKEKSKKSKSKSKLKRKKKSETVQGEEASPKKPGKKKKSKKSISKSKSKKKKRSDSKATEGEKSSSMKVEKKEKLTSKSRSKKEKNGRNRNLTRRKYIRS